MRTTLRGNLIVLLLLGLALNLAACGSDSNGGALVPTNTSTSGSNQPTSSPSTPASGAATGPTTPEPTPASGDNAAPDPTDLGPGLNGVAPGGARSGAIAIMPLVNEVSPAVAIFEAKVVAVSDPIPVTPDDQLLTKKPQARPDQHLTPVQLQVGTVYKGSVTTGSTIGLLLPGNPGTGSQARWDSFPAAGDNKLWFVGTTTQPTAQNAFLPLRAYKLGDDGKWTVSGTMIDANISAGTFTTDDLKKAIAGN
jgi:hypothetical protein